MIASLVMVFLEWNIVTPAKVIGLANFQKMLFGDDFFWLSLYNTAYYTFLAVPLHVVGALILALMMNVQLRGIHFYRLTYYMPSIIPSVANAILWLWAFNPDFGVLNDVLVLLDLPTPRWLQDPTWAKPALILMSMWGLGGAMIIFLAGLQGVPQELYEAAQVDGARWHHQLRFITLPMISHVVLFNLILQIIGSFQVFNAAYIMTNGGPQNSTLFLVLYLYRNGFEFFQMGYASAMAWALFTIVMVFTLIQFKAAGRWVFYEGVSHR
ncbi:MAG: sugar ABC transporter permease [Chloroflexi bacterium]|nr:sugar ABC transporter permease [Chloroflexota bacterium]